MPCLTYRDAPAAVEFLCRVFGFEKKMVVPGENNTIAHAEFTLGNAMVMLGSVKDTDYGRLVRPPRDAGVSTQSIYLVVADADAHHARAKAAGVEILIGLVTQDYGGRDYTCRDPEGHIWTFGTYDPWAEHKSFRGAAAPRNPGCCRAPRPPRIAALVIATRCAAPLAPCGLRSTIARFA